MPLTIGELERLEQVLADSLSADAVLRGIPVNVDPQKKIMQEVILDAQKAANTIVILASVALDDSSGIEGVMWDKVKVEIACFQNPKLVISGLSCRSIAERVAAVVKGNPGWYRNIKLSDPSLEYAAADAEKNLICYIVYAETAANGQILTQLPAITAVNNAGVVTLACAQPGAAIFYRTDGVLPTTSDTLYTAPFASASQTITARAWLQGFLASPWLTLQT